MKQISCLISKHVSQADKKKSARERIWTRTTEIIKLMTRTRLSRLQTRVGWRRKQIKYDCLLSRSWLHEDVDVETFWACKYRLKRFYFKIVFVDRKFGDRDKWEKKKDFCTFQCFIPPPLWLDLFGLFFWQHFVDIFLWKSFSGCRKQIEVFPVYGLDHNFFFTCFHVDLCEGKSEVDRRWVCRRCVISSFFPTLHTGVQTVC